MGLKRRAFLQRTSLALAALGLGDLSLSFCVEKHYRVLAQSTNRKLALLVGINQYPHSPPLAGCLTDVELQRELLIHRFGFHPADILTLTDQQATRLQIESAFLNHLTAQAQAGDVVVFHFSGYGSQLSLDLAEQSQTTLVTVDARPTSGEVPIVEDILEETLLLLLRSLPTDQITTILDTSHTYPGTPLQGNLRIRARANPAAAQPSPAELVLQTELLSQTRTPKEQIGVQRRSEQVPSVMLTAASPTQLATEAQWNGFSAGLFTYALTQYLWQATPATTLRTSLLRVSEQVEQLADQQQQPQLKGQKSREQLLKPYHLPLSPVLGAEGVITDVDENGKAGRIWLGGLPAPVLEYYGTNSLLTLYSDRSADSEHSDLPASLQVQMQGRDGLLAKVKLVDLRDDKSEPLPPLQVGQFVRESVRILPRNLSLTVALDATLERIERVDAISAFSGVPRVTSVVAGEQAADYVFGRVKEADAKPTQIAALPSALPGLISSALPQSSYGLFSLGRDAIPDTVGDGGEAIKVAVKRLVPKLQTLLASKLLALTENEASSQLRVRATLETIAPQVQVILQRQPLRVSLTPLVTNAPVPGDRIVSVPIGSRIQYRVQNLDDRPLHLLLLGLDRNGSLFNVLAITPPAQPLPPEAKLSLQPHVIVPGETLTLPQPSTSFEWVIHGPTGLMTTQLICSTAPFTQTLAALEAAQRPLREVQPLNVLQNPLEVAQAVLHDLHQASTRAEPSPPTAPDIFALNVNSWATLRFVYQIA